MGLETGGSATATEDVGVQQSIRLLLAAQGGRGKLYGDMAGGLLAEGNFNAIYSVDRGVAGGCPAENFDVSAGKEAEVGEVVADLVRELQRFENCGLSNSEIAEGHRFISPDRYTTIAVVDRVYTVTAL